MAINHGSLSAELTPRGVVGGRVQNSVIAYENDYERLINKPSVNNVELDGDLSLEDLGIVNNVQPDWEQDDTEAEDYIKNKPYIPENLSDLNDDSDHRTVTDAEKTTWDNKSDFSGSYNDLTDKPVIPDAQIQSDWNQNDNNKADYIKNKPTIPAEQVNSDWNAESGKAQILNKPSIPTALADLTDDSTHRTVTDTEKTAWNRGEANVQSNWNETDTASDAYIQNKPSIPSVTANPGSTTATLSSIGIDGTNYAISGGSGGGAVNSVNGKTGDVFLDAEDVGALPNDTPLFSGDYEDLTNKPTIPTVNNSTITIQKNGQNVDTFTLNQNTNKAIDISVPTKTSDITNDSSFITNTVNNLANYYLKSETYTKTEISNLIDAAVNGRFEKVQTLPVTGEANVIYLVPKTTALTNNVYDEYIWQDNAWELLGSTEIDLSGYVTDTDLATALANYVTTSAFNTAIANYYTKTEVGNLLDSKVDKVSGKGLSTNDYSNTDKAIVDGVTSALANKADKVSGATNGNLAGLDANGNLTDAGWASDKTTTSESGNPISISGLKSNQLAKNPIITLEPIQAGSGDPSPSNVRAISGYDKIEVLSCGRNLIPYPYVNTSKTQNQVTFTVNSDGSISLSGTATAETSLVLMSVEDNRYSGYRFTGGISNAIYIRQRITDKNGTFIRGTSDFGSGATIDSINPDTEKYNLLVWVVNGTNCSGKNVYPMLQLESGASDTYEPYHKTTDLSLQLGQTVYGGTLDLRSGKFTVSWTKVVLNGNNTESWNKNSPSDDTNYMYWATLSSIPRHVLHNESAVESDKAKGKSITEVMTDIGIALHDSIDTVWYVNLGSAIGTNTLEGFKAYLANNPLEVCYMLETPFTIQLTPHEISLLKDYAYVSTNGTSISFDYHNGEMASLGDVAQLGQTVNELGDEFAKGDLYVSPVIRKAGLLYPYSKATRVLSGVYIDNTNKSTDEEAFKDAIAYVSTKMPDSKGYEGAVVIYVKAPSDVASILINPWGQSYCSGIIISFNNIIMFRYSVGIWNWDILKQW